MAINPVGTSVAFGAQVQEKKKTSPVLPAIAGAVIGGGASAFTKLGKAPTFDNADSFVSTATKKDLEDVKVEGDELTGHKTTLDNALSAKETKSKETTTILDGLFSGETKETEVENVLAKLDGAPTLDQVKASKANAEETKKSDELAAAVKKSAEGISKEKPEAQVIKVGEKNYQVTKADDGAVSFVEGTVDDKAAFTKTANAETKQLSALTEDLEKSKTHSSIADALGITKDTKAGELKVNKDTASKAFESSASKASETVTKAFDALKDHLPKELSKVKVGLYALGGAVLAGIGAMALGGNKE